MVKKLLQAMGLFLIVMAAFALGVDMLMDRLIHYRGEASVPNLIGQPLGVALAIVSKEGLALRKIGEDFNQKLPAGTVLRQVPDAGTLVRNGKAIQVVMSAGGDVAVVPDLIKMELRQAQMELRKAGLGFGEKSRAYANEIPAGQIIQQDPPAQAVGARGSLVNIIVSLGPPPETATPGSAGAAGPGAGGAGRSVRIYYEVPQGPRPQKVKIVVTDISGEREVFESSQPPGSRVDIPVIVDGQARCRIFTDGILVSDQPLQ